jgi:anthranilate synthase component 1
VLAQYKPAVTESELPFSGGALGYVAYDTVEAFHGVRNPEKGASDLPDMVFMIVRTLVSFDNLKHTIRIIHNVHIDGSQGLRELYDDAIGRIKKLLSSLQKTQRSFGIMTVAQPATSPRFKSNVTAKNFHSMVRKAKAYIQAGDVIQVVLSQRLEVRTRAQPFELYRALRFTNPSPYMFYLELEGLSIIGSSPEVLVRLKDGEIELRPIAGTRPRGKTPEEERRLETDLLADPKETAEHIMLVDLGRNDVGRVARIGSVVVDQLMTIERYSHVMHIVSNVKGALEEGKTPFELFVSCFPAGTLSGAPKIRAMQIISELEPQRRGLYGGAIGYFGFNGNLDTCITIRTILMQGNRAVIQAGAGIVADSDPEKEYQETLNKARGMLNALGLAEAWVKKRRT